MLEILRRLLGVDRFERVAPEQRDREDALRSAERARDLARRLRDEKRRRAELALRVDVIRGRR